MISLSLMYWLKCSKVSYAIRNITNFITQLLLGETQTVDSFFHFLGHVSRSLNVSLEVGAHEGSSSVHVAGDSSIFVLLESLTRPSLAHGAASGVAVTRQRTPLVILIQIIALYKSEGGSRLFDGFRQRL